MDTGETVPYGEPATFGQKMKNRFGSNALPGPINGPHLLAETNPFTIRMNGTFRTRPVQEYGKRKRSELAATLTNLPRPSSR